MNSLILTTFFFLAGLTTFAQIDMADSTVQVITYWEMGEKQEYSVTTETIKIKGSDTTSRETTIYDVEISVLAATDKSYTVQWVRSNFRTSSNNPVLQKIVNLTRDTKIIFRTDEVGVFEEVINWFEIKEQVQKATLILRRESNQISGLDQALRQIEAAYSSKEAIESLAIKEIQQFHTFYGLKYEVGQVQEEKVKVQNVFVTEPLDAMYTTYLDEINEEDGNYILRAKQEVDKTQLANATFNYLVTTAKGMKVAPPPNRNDVADIRNEIVTASRIHNTGWLVYSIQTTTVTNGNSTNIEERIIEIK